MLLPLSTWEASGSIMARRQQIPGKEVLQRWLAEDLTQQQIVERIADEYHEDVTRAAVGQAISRYGLNRRDYTRYDSHLPWKMSDGHNMQYQARMLRLLARRHMMNELTAEETRRLDSWLIKIEESDAVVGYDPHKGFAYIPRRAGDPDDIPIRIETVRLP